jgi:hypothetical protein
MFSALVAGGDGAWVRLRGRTPIVLALCVAGLLACALQGVLRVGVARAEAPKLISYGNFGSVATDPLGVAVDQSSGDVYVAGLFNPNENEPHRVEKFDASGKLLPPSPFGEGYSAGAAVNPVNGDLYVLEAFNLTTFEPAIVTYDPSSGAQVGTRFSVPASPFPSIGFTIMQIAADSAGNVYVPVVPQNKVLEYSSTGTLLKTFTGGSSVGALKGPTGVAVDSSGNVWVADAGDKRLEELSSGDAPLAEIKTGGEVQSGELESVALDGHGDVFAIVKNSTDSCGSLAPPCSHLVEYNAAGVQVADVGAGSFETGKGFPLPPMVAVNEVSGRVYVTDSAKEEVWIFGSPTAPAINRELTAEVGTSEAKLGGLVNSGGLQTAYRFEYGTSTAYGQSTPFPEGSAGEGLASHAVWAAASGLVPGTTYHYRVVATNELGTAVGPDQTFTTLTAEQAACTNGVFRSGFSARLPDCRAYELVTVPTKTSVQVEGGGSVAADGNAVAFKTHEPLPGAPTGGNYYVASRGADGWGSEDIIPLESYTGAICSTYSNDVWAFSASLSRAIMSLGHDTRASEPGGSELEKQECNAEGLQVVSGEPVGYRNLLLRDNKTGAYQLVNAMEPGLTSVPSDAHFQGASADLSHVVFSELAPLTANALAGVEGLYEWNEGAVRLLSILPGGTPVSGSLAQPSSGTSAVEIGKPAISVDGSHIMFTSGGSLYVRVDGVRSVQVDESQGSGVSGGGSFATASADGSRVLFTDESRLTSDSTAASGEPDLYECVLPERASKCELSDLTVAKAGQHADVLVTSRLGSKDSSHVYFVAKGVLAANKRQYTDSEGKEVEEGAVNGERNLYVWDGGTITYIATLSGNDFGRGDASPDGAWFSFDSSKGLTGYDNVPLGGGAPVTEVFLYSAASQQVVCASCDPSGEAPIPGASVSLASNGGRPLSDGGRVFFDTVEALVPSDTNGQVDVYEYEDGQPRLISSGTSPNESGFIGASENGNNVFFVSHQQLVPQDTEEEVHVIYDARVDGGLPAVASPPACVTADACRSAVSPQPSIYGAPSSQTFSGAGNLTPASEVKPKKKVKPKKPSKKKVCKRGKHKRARCAAGARRTGSKAKSHKGGK